jgi:hypothetical protein
MMCFTAFPEIQLNPCMRDIRDCRWAKLTHRASITHRAYILVWVARNTHPEHLEPLKPSIPRVPGFNRINKNGIYQISFQ